VEFARYSKLPTINALTDDEASLPDTYGSFHVRGKAGFHFKGKVFALIGDGREQTMTYSWMFAAAKTRFRVYASPRPRAINRAGNLKAGRGAIQRQACDAGKNYL